FAASMGAMGKSSGSTPCVARPLILTRGSASKNPWEETRTAEAPSLMDDELLAVTLASVSSAKMVRSPARALTVYSGRIPSSRCNSAFGTCTIASSKTPSSHALAAIRCERTANSSCASRQTPHSRAIFSADCPFEIVQWVGRFLFTIRQPIEVFHIVGFPAAGQGRDDFSTPYGALLIDSTPPARTAWAS